MRNLMLMLFALAALVAGALAFETPFVAQEDEPEEEELSEEEKTALATKAYFILRNNCWGCHGEPGKEHYGETTPLDWILDYDKLVKHKVVVPGEAGKSRLIRIILTDDMPRAFDEDGKPSKRTDLAEGELETLIDWIKAGAPEWPEFEYTHEWVPLGRPDVEGDFSGQNCHLAVYPVHDGLLIVASHSEIDGLTGIAYQAGEWRRIAEDLPFKVFPIRSVPRVEKSSSWLVKGARPESASVYEWDGSSLAQVGGTISYKQIGEKVISGTDEEYIELAYVSETGHNEASDPKKAGMRYRFADGKWTELDPFPEVPERHLLEDIRRQTDGEVVALMRTWELVDDNRRLVEYYQLMNVVDGEWTPLGDLKRLTAESILNLSRPILAGDAQSVTEHDLRRTKLFGIYFRQSDQWVSASYYSPYDTFRAIEWDDVRSRWIVVATNKGVEGFAVWALVPWRKAEDDGVDETD